MTNVATLIDLCLRTGQEQQARELFDDLLERKIEPSAAIFTSFITSAGKAGDVTAAVGWYKRMRQMGLVPDHILYSSLVDICGRNNKITEAESFLSEMKTAGMPPNVVVYTSLIDACGKNAQYQKAMHYFEEMLANDLQPNKLTFTTLITVCRHMRMPEQALKLYRHLRGIGIEVDSQMIVSLVHTCVTCDRRDEAYAVLSEVQTIPGLAMNANMFNPLLLADQNTMNFHRSLQVFDLMKEAGVTPNDISYLHLLGICKRTKDFAKAKELFDEMRKHDIAPTLAILNEFLDCACKAKLADEALKIYEDFDNFPGCKRDTFTYRGIINAMAHSKNLRKARQLWQEMIKEGVSPNHYTYTAYLDVHLRAGEFEAACRLWEEMRPYRSAYSYTLMLHAYRRKGNVEKANELFKEMSDVGIKPTPVTLRVMNKQY